MPELPEVETVRRGLQPLLVGRTLAPPLFLHPRAVRRQELGGPWLAQALTGATITAVRRRGKYLWLDLDGSPVHALVAHLGMSGQFRRIDAAAAASPAPLFDGHERVRLLVQSGGGVSFVDQRTFGWILGSTALRGGLPIELAHVAADPLSADFDAPAAARAIRARRSGLKRVLLDQRVVSGIGNIYADEALWRSRMHYAQDPALLPPARIRGLLADVRAVLGEALAAGGTSFDPLYVNVNGSSGWFARHLNVYGRAGLACPRCGAAVVRDPFMNRSSYRCPRCQRRPGRPRW